MKYAAIALVIFIVTVTVYEIVGRRRKRPDRLLIPDECRRCRNKPYLDGLCWSCWHGRPPETVDNPIGLK